jgi:hypothetical protein
MHALASTHTPTLIFTALVFIQYATLLPQVLATQHNLPSNSKRQLQFTAFVPEPHRHHQVLCSGLPTELQQSVLNSLSPSGEILLFPSCMQL